MSNTSSIKEIDTRLVVLERQCQMQRFALLVIPIAFLAIGAAANSEMWTGKSVVTERLAVVDSEGRERILLTYSDKGEPFFKLMDTQDKLGIALILVNGEDPVGKFRGKRGSAHIGLNEENDRPMVELVEQDGKLIWGMGGNALD